MLRGPLLRVAVCLTGVCLGGGAAVLVTVAGADSSSTPALELHLDTLENATTSSNGTTPRGTTPDSSGNGLQATAQGTLVSGRFQQALTMGDPGDGVTVADSPLLRPTQLTVMAWVKQASNPGALKMIVAKPGPASACHDPDYALTTGFNGGISFEADADERSVGNGVVQVRSPEGDPSVPWDGGWHAIAGTYDGSTLSFYEDGQLVGSTQVGFPIYTDTDPSVSGLYAGQVPTQGSCDWSSLKYEGGVDEVRVYDRALSAQEIAQLQDASATSPPELTSTTGTGSSTTSPPELTSTTGTGSSTTAPTTTSGAPHLPPPAASLIVLKPPVGSKNPILSAAGTTGASRLLLDLNGDHKTDIALSPSLPYTQLTMPKGGSTTVTLTAVGSLQQQVSKASTTITLAKTAPKFTSLVPQIAVSSSSTAAFTRLTPAQFLQAACVPTEVDFGIIGANGCFKHVTTLSEVPASESDTANVYFDAESQCLGYVQIWPDACDGLNIPYSVYVASRSIKLNGMTLAPNNGAAIVVDPVDKAVYSSNATLKLGPFVIKQGAVVLDFTDHVGDPRGGTPNDLTYTGSTGTLLSFDARKDVPVIGGFPLNAGAELAFASDDGVRKSVTTLHVELPAEFDVFGSGDQPSGAASLAATNDQPLSLDTLDLSVPHASIGGIGLDNVNFHYAAGGDDDPDVHCGGKYWHATADIELGEGVGGQPGPGILMTPPPVQNGVSFCGSDQPAFKGVGAQLNFGCPLLCPPQLFPGVFLDDINFAVQLKPTLVRGGATLSAAELTKVSGTLLAVFASIGDTYTLTAADAGPDLQDLAGRKFSSTSFAIGGAVAVHVPGVGDLNIFHGGAVYSYPDYIGLGAHVDTQLGIFVFHGSLSGQFAINRGLFEVDASAHICVRGFDIACGGGLLVASEKGAVACIQLGPANPGIGVMTNGHVDVWIPDGCAPSHYWSAGRGSFVRNLRDPRAAPGITFTVAKGETRKSVKLVGSGGAPHVQIQGPGGETLTVDADGAFNHGALQAISAGTYSTTWLGLENALPGNYTVTPLSDSVPVASVAETRPGYDSDFRARVSGSGSRLTLHYDARKRGGGQRVTFFEDGDNVMHQLVTSTGGTGTVRFTPAPGAAGTRTIVARATVDGVPIRSQTLAHFRFRGTVKTGRPGKVTVQRTGGTLLVKWTAAAGATRYGVLVTRSDGAQQRFIVSASRRSLRVGRFPRTFGGRLSVSARGLFGDWGAARKSRSFKASEKATSVLVTQKMHKSAHKHQPRPRTS